MPRERRDHEEWLEQTEPVAVVVLNDLAFIMEDFSEIILDFSKLIKSRREEVIELITSAKGNPMAAASAIPQDILGYVMASGMELAGKSKSMRAKLQKEGSEDKSPRGIDPSKIDADELEAYGKLLQAKAHGLEEKIRAFEATLLEKREA